MKAVLVLVIFLLTGAAQSKADALSAPAATTKEVLGSCTFAVNGTFNGVVVNVTITVSEVSALECAVMKAAARKALEPPKK